MFSINMILKENIRGAKNKGDFLADMISKLTLPNLNSHRKCNVNLLNFLVHLRSSLPSMMIFHKDQILILPYFQVTVKSGSNGTDQDIICTRGKNRGTEWKQKHTPR